MMFVHYSIDDVVGVFEELTKIQALDESICQYRKVICNLRLIVGEKSLDTFPRIHTFRASRDFLHYLADNDILSLKGLLAADDDRISYSLTFSENEKLKHKSLLIKNNFCFLKTSQRFDGLGLRKQKKLFSHGGMLFCLRMNGYSTIHII